LLLLLFIVVGGVFDKPRRLQDERLLDNWLKLMGPNHCFPNGTM
jgi:hypothetical protein